MKRILDFFSVWLSLAFFVACLAFSPSWAACQFGTNNPNLGSSSCGQSCSTLDGNSTSASGYPYGYMYDCVNNGCTNFSTVQACKCQRVYCKNSCELDSIKCFRDGGTWEYTASATCGGMSCNTHQCDTTFNCIEYPFNHCEDVPNSGQVYCDENGCTGLPYSRWWSEYRRECTNECGEHRIDSFTGDTLITFDTNCSDSSQCSNETKCVDFPSKQTYLLYHVCIVGNEQIGNGANNRSYPSIVGGGSGSCASLGMPSNNILDPMNNTSNTTFPNSNNVDPITDNCLIYGIDCPENFVDSTDYNDSDNRTPEHCVCEPLDGMKHISTIICPDGSRSTFWGSCTDWNTPQSSSSVNSSSSTNPPESSSSGSENPPTSSGGISGEYPDWNVISRNQKNATDILGSMAQTLKQLPGTLLQGIKEYFNGFAYNESESDYTYERADSLVTFDTIVDTAGILHAVFGRIDSNNTILDTLPHSSFSGCPCITFFRGNSANNFSNGHIVFKQIQYDLGNIHGFNLCRIFSVVVTALASVVSFFIGFAIFRNISQ